MSKSVVINLGQGDLHKGFPIVTAQLWAGGYQLPQQFIGSLPAAPAVVEIYRKWQSMYQNLCNRCGLPNRLPEEDDDDELEIDDFSVTNVSVVTFAELCQSLEENINSWLKSPEFLNIERQLRSRLDTAEEIRVMIETSDLLLRRLPWHRWDFFADYPHAEMALSQPEYKRRLSSQPAKNNHKKVRILAILGNSVGIDLEKEASLLQNIEDAEVVFIVNPSRQEFNTQLWDSAGWDILFFAGHSQTQGETGRIYINENPTNNSLTIEQLQEALLAAIDNGLRSCIFNSCDGLGLANALEKLSIPTVIVMREPVPNLVAQEFFQYFLQSFALERSSLYKSVQQARRKLQGLENDFPGASWLPVICQNPAVEPPTWLNLGGIPPCPYRGLFAFREEDAHLFFGREQFTDDLVAAVKKKPLVAVVGASGSGKSSVVFAGLIPQLRKDTNIEWICVSFRPGNNPFEALAVALASVAHQGENPRSKADRIVELELETQLRQNTTTLAEVIENMIISSLTDHSQYPENPTPKIEEQTPRGTQTEETLDHGLNGTRVRFLHDERSPNLDASSSYRGKPNIFKISAVEVPSSVGGSITSSLPKRLVLIADQFEELYTLCTEEERQRFLDALLHAVKFAPGFTLVTTLRADFYGHALSYRPLSDALQSAVLNLGPMNRKELHQAIEQPAVQMQIELQEGLTKRLIDDTQHPGLLPLLEFALTSLWSQHESGLLTHQAYEEIGGVEEALANHAEAVYAQLSVADRVRAQRVFMQLVRLGEPDVATRRLATRDEVRPENWDLVTHLASKRLVVTNSHESTFAETVEIVHETLIANWGRLGVWIQLDGEFRRAQEQLRTAMQTWESSGFDEGALLRGKPLLDAEYWQQQRLEELSSGERSFIGKSIELRDQEIKKYKRRRQVTILGLVCGLVVTSILTGIALWQSHNSAISEINTFRSSAEKLIASNQDFDALIESFKAGSLIKHTFGVDADTQMRTVEDLQQAVNFVRERNRLEGHNYTVTSVSFSPDGTIATASRDKTVKLWRYDRKEPQTLRGHSDVVNSVSFSPDGKIIASASADKTVKLWTVEGKELQTFRGHGDVVNSVSFSPDGKLIATASSDKTVKLWTVDGKQLYTLRGHTGAVTSVIFSPDGNAIATASSDKTAKLWSREGKELQTLRGHDVEVNSVSFSPDGKTIATAGGDRTIKLWSRDGKELQTLRGHTDGATSVTFSPNGKMIASGSWDHTIKLWSLDGKELRTLRGHDNGVTSLAWSLDGKIIASASADKTVKIWSRDDKQLQILGGHNGGVKSIAWSVDGKIIATASWDKTVKLWNQEGKELQTLKGHQDLIDSVTFSPDGKIIVTASWDKTAKLWNLEGKELQTLKGHQDRVDSATFSPDGKLIATASIDKTVKLWNRDGKELQTLRGHKGGVNSVAFSPDGKLIATASIDKTVKLWNRDGKELQTLRGHNDGVNSVAFSPDGKLIATASSDNTVKLWSRDGKEIRTLRGHQDVVNNVSFSPNGKIIATASTDKTVKLWNQEGKELQTLLGHQNGVTSVSFSPDGKILATASWDKTAFLWHSYLDNFDDLMVRGCSWLHDYFHTNRNVSEGDRHLCDEFGS